MMIKTKTAFAAAFVLATATAAFAQSGSEFQNSPYQLNPNAPVPVYGQNMSQAGWTAEGRNVGTGSLIEGRNVGMHTASEQIGGPALSDRYPSFGGY